ncbi:DeoR/GlpR family DNA-binding transcription regulator [Granulosicoccus antarcticus]|uniref:HTH-type transcriptional repressor GlcR n=1 Tax=Granulosicoccus antarcticus IMCC3135 TaxID=1192854 RepID=A0A2Z2P7Q8_9GAMM|nr:DeoR/GlpR family DNA-binding transcription regulator [Granulosicoccus antarcticus]ASJ76717.1 HTH-type transcriptional repressor GlcR [Granulosicoccus antarcticus IMCC3135]
MSSIELNNPDVRQELLLARIHSGERLVAAVLAKELNVSPDTIRRDLIELERNGSARRVRGGAVPVSQPVKSFELRRQEVEPGIEQLAARAASLIDDSSTVFLDGGTMLHAVACQISTNFRGLVITPAPAIALAVQARGASVYLIGGTLCASGGIATGAQAVRMVSDCAADLCLLGACGMHPSFGLSADDAEEASIKRAMALVSSHVVVVTGSAKLARRARHRVLAIEEMDQLITDAEADADLLAAIRKASVEVLHE